MAKYRTIPFGYMMMSGKIITNPKEVNAVVTIFSEYLKGKSMSDIAAQMDVPYSNGAIWNKARSKIFFQKLKVRNLN